MQVATFSLPSSFKPERSDEQSACDALQDVAATSQSWLSVLSAQAFVSALRPQVFVAVVSHTPAPSAPIHVRADMATFGSKYAL
jgi:hypothetical protein